MHPAIETIPDVDQRLSAGLTVLGFVAGTAALFAVLAMWTLLTSPDRVASAAPGGLPAIFKVVLRGGPGGGPAAGGVALSAGSRMLTMTPPRPVEITPHMAIGVSLALLGVVLTLDNLGFVEFGEVMRFWPLIPMLVGTAYIVQGREIREWGIGLAWLLVGTAFLLRNLDVFHFDLTDFLPLILVAVGLKVIFARHRRRHQAARWPGMPDPAQPPPPPGVPPPFAPTGEEAFATRFPWPPGAPAAPGTAPGTAGAGAPTAGVRGQIIRVFAILWGADRRARGPVAHVEVSADHGRLRRRPARRGADDRPDRDPGVRDVGRHRHPHPARLGRRDRGVAHPGRRRGQYAGAGAAQPPRDSARHGVHGRRRDQELIAGARRRPPCIQSSPAAT